MSFAAWSQSYIGLWEGQLGGMLKLNIEIKKDSADLLQSLISVQAQNIEDLEASETSISDNGEISIRYDQFNASFSGEITHNDTIKGKWNQGMEMDLVLHRVNKKYVQLRPQTPQAPFPYKEEILQFDNEDEGITLEGTLSIPKEKVNKAVLLIAGSGPSDRDQTILGHKPFAVIADHLTRQGIAVLRYDERGVGDSEGNHNQATTMDLAKDAAKAMEALGNHPKVKGAKIGIIGHSEGGLIAPIVNGMTQVDFIISLAGPAVPSAELMTEQNYLILKSMGLTESLAQENRTFTKGLYDIVNTGKPMPELYPELLPYIHKYYESIPEEYQSLFGASKEVYYLNLVSSISSPWMRYFLAMDPTSDIAKIKCPLLAINGALDLQVEADSNLDGFAKHCPHAEIQKIEGLNHLFQNTKTGATSEYGELEESFDPKVLQMMSDWIIALK